MIFPLLEIIPRFFLSKANRCLKSMDIHCIFLISNTLTSLFILFFFWCFQSQTACMIPDYTSLRIHSVNKYVSLCSCSNAVTCQWAPCPLPWSMRRGAVCPYKRIIHSIFLHFKFWDRCYIPCLWCRTALASERELDSEKRAGLTGCAVLSVQHSNTPMITFRKDFS